VGTTELNGNVTMNSNLTVDTDTLFVGGKGKFSNVGIGTTDPSAKLDVVGTTELNGNVTVSSNLTVAFGTLFVDGTSGNVGIGTTIPSAKLDVVGTTELNGNVTMSSQLNVATGTLFVRSLSRRVGIGETSPNTTMHLTHSNGTETNGLTIENGGRWNIYTASADNLFLIFNDFIKGEFDMATGVYSAVSDKTLKKNIEPVAKAIEGIMRLKPSKYHFKEERDSDPKHYGLIAQDLIKVFPEVVTVHDDNGEDGGLPGLHLVAQTELIPILIRGMQEQQEIISDLQSRLARIEAMMVRLTDVSQGRAK
jgi:Chaperone of endosialidase